MFSPIRNPAENAIQTRSMQPSPNAGSIEKEFGVPFPGRILPPDQWTRTAIKRPPEGALDVEAAFGRRAPLIVELGCGNGRYLIGSSLARPDCDHLGIDVLPLVIRYATRRANQRGLANIRFAVRDAETFVERNLAPGSVAEFHVYHPQPYYDPRDVSRRLFQPAFAAQLHQTLIPGGRLFVQTDHPAYWKYIAQLLPFFFEFVERREAWPDTSRGRTRREIIARRKKLPIFRGEGTAKLDLDESQARRLAEQLPPPTFNADRRLQALDRLE